MTVVPRSTLKNIKPYKPGKSIESLKSEKNIPDVIKLASNENPLGASVKADDLSTAIDQVHVYPDPFNHPIYKTLAQYNDMSEENLILGNGSDDILQLAALSYFNTNDEVIGSKHSFSVYEHVSTLMGAIYKQVRMKNYFVDLDGILDAINDSTKAIFIANPNNPTGTARNALELNRFLNQVPNHILVVIDQAYIEYAGDSYQLNAKSIINSYQNVLLTKTFSKAFGLAGFRIGYGLSSKEIIIQLNKTRTPFNVNQLALQAAYTALKNKGFLEKSVKLNLKEKQYLGNKLKELNVNTLPSEGNFLACFFAEQLADDIYDKLLNKGVITRSLTSFDLPNAIRVSVGTREQNNRFLSALKDTLIEIGAKI